MSSFLEYYNLSLSVILMLVSGYHILKRKPHILLWIAYVTIGLIWFILYISHILLPLDVHHDLSITKIDVAFTLSVMLIVAISFDIPKGGIRHG